MSDALSFEVDLGLSRAKADMKQFVVDTQKQLNEISFNPRAKSSASTTGIDHSRDIVNEQAFADRLAQIRSDALQRLDQIDATYGSQQLARRSQLEANINTITSQASNRRVGDVQREVDANLKQFERQARRAQQSANVSPSANGKNLQYVFQAQQAVEDFSYAGLRGASNNIALMASQLGGPAGLIALLGITGVQALSLADSFNQTASDTDQLRLSTERYKSELMALTEVRYNPNDSIVKTQEDVDRLSRAMNKAAGEKRALIETGNKQQDIAGLLTQFKTEMSTVRSRDNFGGANGGDAAVQQALQKIETIREKLKSIEPNFDWDKMLGEKSFQQIDAIIKSVDDGTAEWLGQLARAGLASKAAWDEWVKGVEQLKKVREFEAEHGLRVDEAFRAYTDAESSAEKVQIRKLDADVKYWEARANDAKTRLDGPAYEAATAKAREAANNAQKLRDAVDAVKKAEREQLDQARDALRLQKEKNAEKERELSTEEQLLKAIEKEARSQRVNNATGDIDTRKGMVDNAINRSKARDEQLIGMSPNQEWQQMMQYRIDAYYDAMQARADRFYAQEKQQQLKAKADSAAMTDPKEQRQYLEELQQHQRQNAMNARTPQEAQYWYNKSLETQKMIEESFAKQKQQQAEKISGIKDEIKSVEDLEKRVELLSDAIRDVPLLDMENQGVIDYLENVKSELREILELQQQMERKGGGSGGAPFDSSGGGNPFGGFDWGHAGGNPVGGDEGNIFAPNGGNPFGGVDWNDPKFGGAGENPIAGTSPAGGWGFGEAYPAGFGTDARSQVQSMAGAYSSLPQAAFGGGNGTTSNQYTSIGNMPIYVNGGNFNANELAASARRQANNALLRRGA